MTLLDVLTNSVKNTTASKILAFRQNLAIAGFWLLTAYSSLTFSADCSSDRIDLYAVVSQVFDGDTVKLTNGKHIRLIGINTPEVNYKTGNPEPFAEQARSFLKQKVLKQKIGLRFGSEKKDRHGRLLAHIFINDKINIQQLLLAKGLAVSISFPPNLWQQDCYLAAEKSAKQKRIGVWKNYPANVLDAQNIKKTQTGFQFVKGKISEIRQNKKIIWLKLSNDMSLRIYKENLPYFKNLNIERLRGKRVIARGWISRYKKHYYMTIGHPNALQLL